MNAHHRRKTPVLALVCGVVLIGSAAAPATASALSLDKARGVAVVKMKRMERKLASEGANTSGVRGCWRERGRVACLGMVSGRDSFLRWRCAVPMTVRKRTTASASRARVAVKFTDPLCSF